MDNKKVFIDQLKDKFIPLIRNAGFKGSGNHFRRITNEVIHALNIQWRGEGCCINLGVHLSFLPMWGDHDPSNLIDPKTVKVGHCELSKRLAPSGETDHWWGYWSHIIADAIGGIDRLVATYVEEGEPFFDHYRSVENFVSELHIDVLSENSQQRLWGISQMHGVLTMARIYKHLGDISKQKMYAEFGLSILGDGFWVFKKELKLLSM